MFVGMECAVRWWGYEGERSYTHAKIVNVSSGGGHTQKHTVIQVDDDGAIAPGAMNHDVPARRIIMSWQDYMAKCGAWLTEKEETDFKELLKKQVIEGHVVEAEELCGLLALVGIDAFAQRNNYGFDPAVEDSCGAQITIRHPNKLKLLVEPIVRERMLSAFGPTASPFRSGDVECPDCDLRFDTEAECDEHRGNVHNT